MNIIPCLYVEDDQDERNRYKGWLERAWKNLNNGTILQVTEVETPEEALRTLNEVPGKFKLLVADILFRHGNSNDPLGLSIISQVREDHWDMAIVAFSIGNGGYEQKALD